MTRTTKKTRKLPSRLRMVCVSLLFPIFVDNFFFLSHLDTTTTSFPSSSSSSSSFAKQEKTDQQQVLHNQRKERVSRKPSYPYQRDVIEMIAEAVGWDKASKTKTCESPSRCVCASCSLFNMEICWICGVAKFLKDGCPYDWDVIVPKGQFWDVVNYEKCESRHLKDCDKYRQVEYEQTIDSFVQAGWLRHHAPWDLVKGKDNDYSRWRWTPSPKRSRSASPAPENHARSRSRSRSRSKSPPPKSPAPPPPPPQTN